MDLFNSVVFPNFVMLECLEIIIHMSKISKKKLKTLLLKLIVCKVFLSVKHIEK